MDAEEGEYAEEIKILASRKKHGKIKHYIS